MGTTNDCRNVVSTWSSGTGGAGVIGSISYAGLIQLGVSSKDTMLIMIVVPVVEAIAFWLVLRRPTTASFDPMDAAAASSTDAIVSGGNKEDVENTQELSEGERPLVGLKNKLKYVPKLFKYMIPLTLVYFLEYLINQGLVSVTHILLAQVFQQLICIKEYIDKSFSSKNRIFRGRFDS